jgi:hypothetical protein
MKNKPYTLYWWIQLMLQAQSISESSYSEWSKYNGKKDGIAMMLYNRAQRYDILFYWIYERIIDKYEIS